MTSRRARSAIRITLVLMEHDTTPYRYTQYYVQLTYNRIP